MTAVQGQLTLPLLTFQHHVGQLYVDPTEIQFVQELRQSDLAIVEQGRWRRADGKTLSIICKVWRPFVIATPQDFRELLLEASKLHRLQHSNLPRFLGLGCFAHGSLAEVRESMFMVEEFVGERTLRKTISEQMRCRHKNLYDMRAALRWANQVASALDFLHQLQPAYVHNDVKADNVVLTDTNRLGAAQAKLGDLKPHRHVYDREPCTLSRHQQQEQQQQRTSCPNGAAPNGLQQPKYTLERNSFSGSTGDECRPVTTARSTSAAQQLPLTGCHGLSVGDVSSSPPQQQQSMPGGSKLAVQCPQEQQQQPTLHSSCCAAASTISLAECDHAPPDGEGKMWLAHKRSAPVCILAQSRLASSNGGSCPRDWFPGEADAHSEAADAPSSQGHSSTGSQVGVFSSASADSSSCCVGADVSRQESSVPDNLHSLTAEVAAADAAASTAAAPAGPDAASLGSSSASGDAQGQGSARSWWTLPTRRPCHKEAFPLSDSASSAAGASRDAEGLLVKSSTLSASVETEDALGLAVPPLAARGREDVLCDRHQESRQCTAAAEMPKALGSSKRGSSKGGIPSAFAHASEQQQGQGVYKGNVSDESSWMTHDVPEAPPQTLWGALCRRAKSSPLDAEHNQQSLKLASSAPDILGGADHVVHDGALLLPLQLSEPTGLCNLQSVVAGSTGFDSSTGTSRADKAAGRRCLRQGASPPRLTTAESIPEVAAGSGSCVYYGWELLPSGAATPCGAVHSSLLDLFADVSGDDSTTCRRYRDSYHYTLVPGSFVQQKSPLSSAGAGGLLMKTPRSTWEADVSVVSTPAAGSNKDISSGSSILQPASSKLTADAVLQMQQQQSADCQRDRAPVFNKGSAPIAIESKQHGSNSAFAALTAIDCIAEECSSMATESCPPSRDSSGHCGTHFYSSVSTDKSSKRSSSQDLQSQHSNANSLLSGVGLSKALGLTSLLRQCSNPTSLTGRCSSEGLPVNGDAEADADVACSPSRTPAGSPMSRPGPGPAAPLPVASADPHPADVASLQGAASSAGPAFKSTCQPPSGEAQPTLPQASPVKQVRFSLARPQGSTASRDYSLVYAAPELVRGERPTEKVDVFAFGMLLYELLSRQLIASSVADVCSRNSSRRGRHHNKHHQLGKQHPPDAAHDDSCKDSQTALQEQSEDQLLLTYAQLVAGGYRPRMLPHFPDPVVQLIQRCWAAEPHQRPRMSEVLQELQSWQKNKQVLSALNSFVLALADMGYPGNKSQQPGCGCVIS